VTVDFSKRSKRALDADEAAQQARLIEMLKPAEGAAIEVEGRCDFVFAKPEHNGWGFAKLRTDDKLIVPVTGQVGADLYVGARVKVYGFWVHHARYGWQAKVRSIEVVLSSDFDGVTAWFESRFDNVGPVRARRLLEAFGDQIWNVIENHPERLKEVDGIGETLAEQIQSSYRRFRQERDTYVTLAKLGLGAEAIQRVTSRWGWLTVCAQIEENPYILTEISGIGFKGADRLARNAGIGGTDERRVVAGFLYAMELLEREGHTCATPNKLMAKASSLDVLNVTFSVVQKHWAAAVERGELVGEFGVFFRKSLADAEHLIAEQIAALVQGPT